MAGEQNSETTEMFRRMALSMFKGAPAGFRRTSLSARADRHGASGGVTNVLAGGRARPGPRDFHQQLSRVYDLAGTGTDELGIEIVVDPTGRFEAVTGRALLSRRGSAPGTEQCLYVRRPDVLPPDAGDDAPGPSRAARSGDPVEAVQLLDRYLRKRAAILGLPEGDLEWLPRPLEPAEIDDLEQSSPDITLPEDLRALYAVADGDGGDGGARLMDRHSWFDLRHVAARYRSDLWWLTAASWSSHHPHAVRYDASPFGLVRRSARRPGWIPFAENGGGDFLAVDMDPAEGGRPGQVIRIGRNHDDGPVHVADSVTALLRAQLDALERGAYECDVENGELWIETGLPKRRRAALSHSRVHEAAASLDNVQALVTTGETDLEPLRGARRLWRVCLSGATAVELAPLGDVPLESLELDLASVDLAPLTEHPTLRTVTVRTAAPLSLAPLRDCPRLYGLDLSNAAVRDIETVAEMKGLLYLSLRHEQWLDLWDRTGSPFAPAVPVLAGTTTPGQLVEWAAHFADGDQSDALHYYEGQLTV
ncbi:SMI1/KNR4 family protein [Streptomyces sp. NBC_01511]|uniref:SMI1/KNR4 family protein n=1 Tax=Streptomyces sp. NBC_01511 TaxID=2903889 RepID=UPI00386B5961